jgi:hypothetical protein
MQYANGKIYKIVPMCEYPAGDVYIGATCQPMLSRRMSEHRSQYKRWKQGKGYTTASHILFEKYGVDGCEIILIDSVKCNNKDELNSKESNYIRNILCVNKSIPGRTVKQYYLDNRDKQLSRQKNYNIINRDKIKDYYKEHYINNREVILARQKAYEAAHKNPCICLCGGKYNTNFNKKQHLITKKHIKYIESQNNIISE